MLIVNVINQSKVKAPKKFINTWLVDTVKLLPQKLQKKINGKILNIVFLDQRQAKKLNLTFRNKNYATDVLSFDPLDHEELGELVICPQVIQRQAKEHKMTEKEELGYMLIHGCLHLMGYDHEKNEIEAKRMFQLQDKIFSKILAKDS